MRKYIICIILIISLLIVTACNKEKKETEESTEPIISDIPTEIPDNDQIKDKKTGAIFGVDREIKGIQSPSLTDADSVQIILNQSTYYFPFVFSRFDNEGWTYFDNAAICCLRLLARAEVSDLAIAGFNGFLNHYNESYADRSLPTIEAEDYSLLNWEIGDMYRDFIAVYGDRMKVEFVTESPFATQKR